MMDSTVLDVKRCADLLGGGGPGGRPACGPVHWELDRLKICDVVYLVMVYCVIGYDFKR